MGFLFRRSPINVMEGMMRFVNKPTRSTGRGKNVHISKRAQLGLYHGKDVQFGKSIAPHSKTKTLKKWLPNVINKRVWSETLDDWVRFKMTTTALKKIDYIGGIDNYLLSLDNKSVALSNYITKMRNIIGTSLFLKGELSPLYIRKLGYGKNPPVAPVAVAPTSSEDDEVVHFE